MRIEKEDEYSVKVTYQPSKLRIRVRVSLFIKRRRK